MNNTYMCAFCGKEHNTPEERMRCETSCYKKQEEEKLKAEQERIAEERRKQKEIQRQKQFELAENRDKRIKEINQLLDKFNADYNTNYAVMGLEPFFDHRTPLNRLLDTMF